MTFKIELGSTVKDKLTSLTGTVVGRHEWLYGCRTYTVQPRELKDGKPIETHAFDEDRLEVEVQAAPHVVKDTGGPAPQVSRPSGVTR